ncbi:MAG: XrtA system polysaccharide deacetylase [Gemmataceae bacterium]
MLNAFTIDVEDYFQVSAFEGRIQRRHWEQFPSRVVDNTHKLLDLLARHQVRGTFFVLGWIAQRFPKLVKAIDAAGHEIGSHSFWHRLIYQQTPEEFRDDLRQSRAVLQDVTGKPVLAYRAPSFSITRDSLWAFDILQDEGIQYDSSVQPIVHDRYGIPDANPLPHRIGSLWEFPPAVHRFAWFNLPVSGGGYFRLYPLWWTVRCLRLINERRATPFVFYVHPWEIDPEQPRLQGSWLARRRHYLNLASTEAKLDRLLGEFSFGKLSEALPAPAGTELETAHARS